ncbi:MAG: hypothetical protein P8Y97_11405 [Candidatus Lokiarchaeota archaeon]
MKLRLVLKTKTKNDKEVTIKFNIAPSQHLGFINLVNLALNTDNPVNISFEKISKTGEKESSKIEGEFKFNAKDKKELEKIEQEVRERDKK